MANVIINDTNLTNIANAIREKNGTTNTYKPSEMAAAITNLPTGGSSGGDLDAFITGTLTEYRNSELTEIRDSAFYSSKLEIIDLPNVTEVNAEAFRKCDKLKSINLSNLESIVGNYVFANSGYYDTEYDSNFNAIFKRKCDISLPKITSLPAYTFQYAAFRVISLPSLTQSVIQNTFNGCNSAVVDLGPDCYYLAANSFSAATRVLALVLRRTEDAVQCAAASSINNAGFTNAKATGYVYVPSALIETYKAANIWTNCSDRFRVLEEYTLDGTTTGELDLAKMDIEEV